MRCALYQSAFQLHRLARPRGDHAIGQLRVHPRDGRAGHARVDQPARIHLDAQPRTGRVPLDDRQHRAPQPRAGRVIREVAGELMHRVRKPQRHVRSPIHRLGVGFVQARRQQPAAESIRQREQQALRLVQLPRHQEQPGKTDQRLPRRRRSPRVVGRHEAAWVTIAEADPQHELIGGRSAASPSALRCCKSGRGPHGRPGAYCSSAVRVARARSIGSVEQTKLAALPRPQGAPHHTGVPQVFQPAVAAFVFTPVDVVEVPRLDGRGERAVVGEEHVRRAPRRGDLVDLLCQRAQLKIAPWPDT